MSVGSDQRSVGALLLLGGSTLTVLCRGPSAAALVRTGFALPDRARHLDRYPFGSFGLAHHRPPTTQYSGTARMGSSHRNDLMVGTC